MSAETLPSPDGIVLNARGHGWVLADATGMTLYEYAKDQRGGAPVCEGTCAEDWPPLLAPENGEFGPDWSIVIRELGDRQWAFRGKPLYRYALDVSPGDMNGDDFQQLWSVAVMPITTPPAFGIFKTSRGHLLVDQRNMTLYTSDADSAAGSTCNGPCTRDWRPIEAFWLAKPPADDWSIIARDDGTRQWAFKGKPLYRFARDFAPGEIAGTAVNGWHAVVLEPPPPIPDWVTYQKSDGGELLADANGKTLYAKDREAPPSFNGVAQARSMETPELWTRVLAGPNDKPIGQWSIIQHEDGTRQWAHKGKELFINVRDKEPGDLNGIRSTDRVWHTIMRSGASMAGAAN